MAKWIVTQHLTTEHGEEKRNLTKGFDDSNLPAHNSFEHDRHYGTSVFEGIRAFWDKNRNRLHVPNFDQHINRLFNSMSALYMIAPKKRNHEEIPSEILQYLKSYNQSEDLFFKKDKDFVKNLIIQNVLANIEVGLITPENDQIYIRPLATRFDHPEDKLGVHSTTHRICLEVMVQEWPAYLVNPTLALYDKPISNPLRQHKCGANYGFGGVAKNWATADLAARYGKMFNDALIQNPNCQIDEATGANFFVFDAESNLWTPPLTQYILSGTKRDTAIKMARSLGLNVILDNIYSMQLFHNQKQGATDSNISFKSAFLTGTATGFENIHLLYDPTTSKYTFFNQKI